MTKQEANKAASDELRKFQDETVFPLDSIAEPAFESYSLRAFRSVPIHELGVDTDTLEKLITPKPNRSVWEVANQIRMIRQTSPVNLSLEDPESIVSLNRNLDSMWKVILEISGPKEAEIKEKYSKLLDPEPAGQITMPKKGMKGKNVKFPTYGKA
jgi:hypothetical protein